MRAAAGVARAAEGEDAGGLAGFIPVRAVVASTETVTAAGAGAGVGAGSAAKAIPARLSPVIQRKERCMKERKSPQDACGALTHGPTFGYSLRSRRRNKQRQQRLGRERVCRHASFICGRGALTPRGIALRGVGAPRPRARAIACKNCKLAPRAGFCSDRDRFPLISPMSLFIGIDSGTQSVKAVVLDLETRKVIAEARAPHRLIEGLPVGHMEQHPQEWVAALDTVLADVATRIDRPRVRGMGVSGQQHGFVPLDAAGDVIRPAKLWCDTSTTAECAIITKKLGGPKAAIRRTGNLILPGFTAPKILWLKRREPENYRRLRHVLLPHDYLNFFLTGNYFMEYGDASGTALMDVRKRAWSQEAIRAIDPHLADFLPALSGSEKPAGTLRPELARKFGFPAGVVVSAGGGDNMMGAIGTGNVAPGVVTASFGTSGTIYAHANKPVIDPHGEIAAFCSSTDGWLPLLCTMNVTTVTEQARALLRQDFAALNTAVESAPAGAGPAAAALLRRRTHAQRARWLGRPAGIDDAEFHAGPPRAGRDGRGDDGHELRPAAAGDPGREGEGNPGDRRRGEIPRVAATDGRCFRRARGRDGRGRGRRPRRRAPGRLVRGASAKPPRRSSPISPPAPWR